MAFSWMKKAPQGPQIEKAPQEGIEAFKKFYEADSLVEILDSFTQVCDCAKIERGGRYVEFFPYLKAAYLVSLKVVTTVTFHISLLLSEQHLLHFLAKTVFSKLTQNRPGQSVHLLACTSYLFS